MSKKKLKDKPEYLEIRGEVYMTEADFEKVNEKQELLGKKLFANPRNCAAGTLRQLDTAVTKERGLSMFIFNIQDARGISFETHTEGYEYLKNRAFGSLKNIRSARQQMKSGQRSKKSARTAENCHMILMARW